MSSPQARRSYIPTEAIAFGQSLEEILPFRAVATLTFPRNASILTLDGTFARWIDGVQAHNKLTLGFIRAYEIRPRRHIHAALVAAGALDCLHAALLWQSVIGRASSTLAQVKPYQAGLGGLGYLAKTLDSPGEDVQMSKNLSAFGNRAAHRFFGLRAPERRQLRRIKLQWVRAHVGTAASSTCSGVQRIKAG